MKVRRGVVLRELVSRRCGILKNLVRPPFSSFRLSLPSFPTFHHISRRDMQLTRPSHGKTNNYDPPTPLPPLTRSTVNADHPRTSSITRIAWSSRRGADDESRDRYRESCGEGVGSSYEEENGECFAACCD